MGRSVIPNGKEIVRLRQQKCWEQARLAEQAGLSVKTIDTLENARSRVLLSTIRLVAEALDVSPERLQVNGSEADDAERAQGSVKLPGELQDFADNAKVQRLLKDLQEAIGAKSPILLLAITTGCVVLRLDFDVRDLIRLIKAYSAEKLAALSILSIEVPRPLLSEAMGISHGREVRRVERYLTLQNLVQKMVMTWVFLLFTVMCLLKFDLASRLGRALLLAGALLSLAWLSAVVLTSLSRRLLTARRTVALDHDESIAVLTVLPAEKKGVAIQGTGV